MSCSPVLIFFEPRLRALRRTLVLVGQWPGHRPPEQVGRRGDIAVAGEFLGDLADVGIDAVNGAGEHHRRYFLAACGQRE